VVPSAAAPPIVVNEIRYRVLRLKGGKRGPKFLLRSDDGHLFGVYERNAQAALSAALLELKLIIDTFRGFDLCETPEGTLFVRG